jgi:hypothetical protein
LDAAFFDHPKKYTEYAGKGKGKRNKKPKQAPE